MYCIIKHIENIKTGKTLPVIILNSDTEVWEFNTKEEAEKLRDIFQTNSDSNHSTKWRKYKVMEDIFYELHNEFINSEDYNKFLYELEISQEMFDK